MACVVSGCGNSYCSRLEDIFTLILKSHCYDDPTARILDVGVPPWKPVPAYHTAVGPQYISIGALNPNNNLHFSQFAQHNAPLMQQVKGFNAPVTQYRNPFPMFQPVTQARHNHHHFILPKDNVQHLHTSASNIAQTVLPSNYLKPAFITGKPAFNLKPEYITKPEFYNGIHTTLAKNPQVPGFKQIPASFKDAMASFFQQPSPYKDFVLGQPQPQFQNQAKIFAYNQQQSFKDKPVGSFSFPNDGVGSLTFFGPASHLIRGGSKPASPKPQPTIFFPAEIGSNFRNGQQFPQPNRQLFSKPPQLFQSVQPIRYESSTPSYFGTTSVKISPSQSYELTISKTPDGKEVVSSSTTSPLPQNSESSASLQHSEQVKSQVLPPIPASVLTPFFHQIQQQQSNNANIIQTVPKNNFIKDEYSEHLVPPPYIHQESSTFGTTPYSPTRRPIAHQEQANALNILNKYNIPIISPLQDATKFKYEDISRKPTIIPLNYTVSSVTPFPTNAPQNTPLSIQPTGVSSGVETFTNNNHNFFENNAQIQHFGRPSASRDPPIPQKDTYNSEHTFFTINDALAAQPTGHQTPVSPTTVLSNTPTQLQVQENPEVIVNEEPSTLTASPPRSTTQQTRYRSTTTITPLSVLPLSSTESLPTSPASSLDQYGSRNRLRGKNRRRRPRPTSTNEASQPTNDEHSAYLQQDIVRERPATAASPSTTERNIQRMRTGTRGRPQSRPSEDQPSADPTLKVVQRNSLKSRFNTVVKTAQNRQPTEMYSSQTVEYHPSSLKTTLAAQEEGVDMEDQDAYLSTTAAASEDDNVISALQQDTNNFVFNDVEETTVSDSSIDEPVYEPPKQPLVEPNIGPDASSIQTPAPSTEHVVLNQTPQQIISEPTKPAEDVDQHVSHRQRYRYKLKTTQETIIEPEAVPSEEPKQAIFSSTSSTASNDVSKGVTKLRPVNKYRSQDRPRFSVKDYRQRVRSHSSTTTSSTEAPSYSSTTSGYNRSRLRFPTRKRLLPSLRTRGSTTQRSVEPDANGEQADYNSEDKQSSLNEGQQVATATSTTTSQSSSSRRVSIRRGSNNRYRGSTSTTESSAVSNEELDRKTPVRQWSRERYNHRSRFSTSTTESAVQAHQLNLNPEDLNNIAVDTEISAVSSTTESRPETAIMKINKSDHSNKQSSESFDDDGKPVTGDDLNQSPSEQSERVAQLTLSGSSHKFNSLSRNNLSRRIPGYFTLATEDPILPIEAFFPNVKNNLNRNR